MEAALDADEPKPLLVKCLMGAVNDVRQKMARSILRTFRAGKSLRLSAVF